MKWNLSDLYRGIADPKIKKDKKLIEKLTASFNKKYKGKIEENISLDILLAAIKDKENLSEFISKFGLYSDLLLSQNQGNAKIAAFNSDVSEFVNKISSSLVWFTIAIKQIPISKLKLLIKEKKFLHYQRYLSQMIVTIPFTLTEKEEILDQKKDLTGADAFVKFYDKIESHERFKLNKKRLTFSEINTIASFDQNRDVRKQARIAISDQFSNQGLYYTFILNTLLLERKNNLEIRGYTYLQQPTLISYELEKETLDSLVSEVQKGYGICEKFYETKKKVLGYSKLYDWDRYSAPYPTSSPKYSWNEAKEIVLSAFLKADKQFYEIAKMFFDKNWIDSDLAPHKRSGAYCAYSVPSLHPYVFMNFRGEISDITTLAHELGHAIHAYLSRNNNFYNFYPSTAVAEIASIFAESLAFDYLYDNIADQKVKINMLANKIQNSFATVFRQTAFYLFELDISNHRRDKGELSTKEFSNYYQSRLQKMFGSGLTLTKYHQNNWMPILHFYHYNFYVFTYALGELLTHSLYQKYKTGDRFMKQYKNALIAGGSSRPSEIVKLMGLDINKPEIWKIGLEDLDNQVTRFQKLVENK